MSIPAPEIIQSASGLDRRLWLNKPAHPGLLIRSLRLLINVIDGAFSDQIWVRAGYMTYLSLFHLVPMGALALALAGRLGWQDNLVNWISQRLSPTAPELATNLIDAMQGLDLYAVGVIGLGAVLIASVFAVSELEEYLSHLWHAHGAREWWKRLVFYPLTIVMAPAVLAVILALGAIAENRATEWIGMLSEWGSFSQWLYDLLLNVPFLFRLVPYVMTWLGLSLFYYLITSAPIRFRSAAVGGVTAGIIWQLAQQAYISFQFGFSTYREIWGYLAQIPLLLLWLYLSWIIFYIGAEVVFAWQYRKAFMPKWTGVLPRSIGLEQGAVTDIYAHLVSKRDSGSTDVCTPELSSRLLIPWTLVEFATRRMAERGLLAQRRTSSGFCYSIPSTQVYDHARLLEVYNHASPEATEDDGEDAPIQAETNDASQSDNDFEKE